MLTWISEQAKWVIYTFIVFIIIGLLFMDGNSLGGQSIPPVAVADGEEVSFTEYKMRLESREQQLAGRNLGAQDRANLQKEVLKELIQRRKYDQAIQAHEVYASKTEMFNDLLNNPPAAWKRETLFQTDSVFDQNKWKAWLQNDSIYDMVPFRSYESFLRMEKVPQLQLQTFLGAGYHPTSLEAEFMIERRDTRYKLLLAKASLDSFSLPKDFVTEEKIKAYFEAHKDSFVVTADMADYEAVIVPQKPGPIDEEHALKFATYLLNQIKEGVDFAELARENSEDQGSAVKGGLLGEEYMPKATYVKEFSEAAFALDSGKVSEPVKTQFGYHIIKSHGKVEEEGVEKAKLSHILIKVSVGTETLDSLQGMLDQVHADVIENGKSLEEAAKAQNLTVEKVTRVPRGGAFGNKGFFLGLESYTWHNQEGKPVSKVLQNDRFFLIAKKVGVLEKGKRDLQAYKSSISNSIVRDYKAEQAKAFLTGKAVELKASQDPSSLAEGKLKVDSTQWVSLDSYIPGIGFANLEAGSIAKAKKGEWTEVFNGERNVVMAKVLEVTKPTKEQIQALVRAELNRQRNSQGQMLFGEWTELLYNQTEVEDQLHVHFSK